MSAAIAATDKEVGGLGAGGQVGYGTKATALGRARIAGMEILEVGTLQRLVDHDG